MTKQKVHESKTESALVRLLHQMLDKEHSILIAKGNDYAGANRLGNFERIAERLCIKPEIVLLIYAEKHFDRIRTWAASGSVSSESVEDSIGDLRNYMALLRLMIEAGKIKTPTFTADIQLEPLDHLEREDADY